MRFILVRVGSLASGKLDNGAYRIFERTDVINNAEPSAVYAPATGPYPNDPVGLDTAKDRLLKWQR